MLESPATFEASDPLAPANDVVGPAMQAVERELGTTYRSSVEIIPEISSHLIEAGGKRIRPLLLLLCARASGGDPDTGLDLAVACELLHSATLLHDDVVDRSELRRGVPAAPRLFGNSASVLVGDFLLAQALARVVGHGDLDLLRHLSRVLAAMAEGELLQLVRSGSLALSMPDYAEIISGKTAGLFCWCCRAGASLSRDAARSEAAASFGRAFGMAFQIIDDVLDFVAPPELSGKDLANDLLQGKATLPLLLACEEDTALLARVERAVRSPDLETCSAIAGQVQEGQAIDRAIDIARQHADRARSCLPRFASGAASSALAALSDHVTERVRTDR
ncbi:MAG: polyprenyl synthetase family protein [Deltaproteobacteria bacterium]|nr:polyprenyl synthetase family protein [Deltaproteobacteria bacterium]